MLSRLRALSSAVAGARSTYRRQFSSVPSTLRPAFSYCISQVRKYEPENFHWCCQLPKELRPSIFALRALNIETSLVGDAVTTKEVPVLQLRFQWWREGVVAAAAGDPPPHPVLLALSHVLPPLKTAKYNIKRIIDTREDDCESGKPPLAVAGLEEYSEGTVSQLLYLQLQAAGVQNKTADHAASHLGKALGIMTLLRGTRHHAQLRRSYLPLQLCAEKGVSQEEIYRGQTSEGLRDVVLQVASTAKSHLEHAREMMRDVPVPARHLFLGSVACDAYLDLLEKCNFDPFDAKFLEPVGKSLTHTMRIQYHIWRSTY